MAPQVPTSLRAWFLLDFLVALSFGLPLFFIPQDTLRFFGWITSDPAATRVVAAALLALGVRSLLLRRGGFEAVREAVSLRLLWSAGAAVGLALTAAQGAAELLWAFAAGAAGFAAVWLVYARRLRRLAA